MRHGTARRWELKREVLFEASRALAQFNEALLA